jgi:cell division septal protein FtsQ
MRISVHFLIQASTFAVLFSSCVTLPKVAGNGQSKSVERTLPAFEEISVEGEIEVVLIKGTTKSVIVTTDDNLVGYVKTEVEGDRLNVFVECECQMIPTQPVVVQIPTEGLDYVQANDRTKVSAGSITIKDIEIELNDDAQLTLKDIDAEHLEVIATNSSKVEMSGKSQEISIQTEDDATLDARNLVTQDAEVDSSGDSNVSLQVIAKLDAELSDDAVLKLQNEPKEQKTQLDDSSSILRQY